MPRIDPVSPDTTRPIHLISIALIAIAVPYPAAAQRTDENATASAADAFGISIGNESVGLYSADQVRGFSPLAAGNLRLHGLYLGNSGTDNPRLISGSSVRVGISAQGYLFPAPTGIVDYVLRPAGREALLSAVAYGSATNGIDLDAQVPVSSSLSIATGISFTNYLDAPGGDYANYVVLGVAPDWRPTSNLQIRPYWGRQKQLEDRSTPFIFVDGPFLPPRIPHRFQGQRWASWHGTTDTYGLIGSAELDRWQVRAGAFRRKQVFEKSFNTLFVDTQRDGTSRYLVNTHPRRPSSAGAGEVRVSRSVAEGPRTHDFHLSLSGRTAKSQFGGEDIVDLGNHRVGTIPRQFDEPEIEFQAVTRDKIRQLNAGLAYHGLWPDRAELGLGIQKVDYRKAVSPPGLAPIVTRDKPLLWNGTLALNLTRNLAAYVGYTKGLEDSDVAPEIAVNRSEAPPALRTSQRDLGIRWTLPRNMRFVVGAFDVRKPYLNLDPSNLFTRLGTITQQGLELSLSGEPIKGLNLVAGAVLLRPRVSGEAVDLGLIGKRPIGQAARTVQLAIDYRFPRLPALSLDVSLEHLGRRPANLANDLSVPARTVADLGARYRFKLDRFPAVLRVQASNAGNTYGWNVTGSGGFRRIPPRRLSTSLIVDF